MGPILSFSSTRLTALQEIKILVSYLDHLKVVKNWLLALSSRNLKLFFLLIGDDNNFLEEVKVTDIKEDKSQNQTTTTEAIAAPKAPSLSPPSSSMLKVS